MQSSMKKIFDNEISQFTVVVNFRYCLMDMKNYIN